MFAATSCPLPETLTDTLLPAPPPIVHHDDGATRLAPVTEETAHVFGRSSNLVGVSVRPQDCWSPDPSVPELHSQAGASPQQDLCVIMLTAGMLHHAGPYRLHVEMANRLAAAGVASFRFDLSGIGESVAIGSASDSLGRAVDECRQAMDYLYERYGFKRFMLFGLCSGADDAIQIAVADRRVQGAILMDGCGFRTAGYYVHRVISRYLPKLLSPKTLLRRLRQASAQTPSTPASLADGDDIREFPDRIVAAAQIQELIDRGTSLLFLYTGGAHPYFNHHRQFRAMFPDLHPRGRVRVVFQPDWDHVAYLPEDRDELIEAVVAWVRA